MKFDVYDNDARLWTRHVALAGGPAAYRRIAAVNGVMSVQVMAVTRKQGVATENRLR